MIPTREDIERQVHSIHHDLPEEKRLELIDNLVEISELPGVSAYIAAQASRMEGQAESFIADLGVENEETADLARACFTCGWMAGQSDLHSSIEREMLADNG